MGKGQVQGQFWLKISGAWPWKVATVERQKIHGYRCLIIESKLCNVIICISGKSGVGGRKLGAVAPGPSLEPCMDRFSQSASGWPAAATGILMAVTCRLAFGS